MQPKAVIQIVLMPNGQLQVQVNSPDMLLTLGMLEAAKNVTLAQQQKQNNGQAIEVAPAGAKFEGLPVN